MLRFLVEEDCAKWQSSSTRKRNIGVAVNLFTRKQSFGIVLFNEETKHWRNCQSFHEKAVIWHSPLQRGNEKHWRNYWQLRQCFVSSLKRTVPNDCFLVKRLTVMPMFRFLVEEDCAKCSHLAQSSSTRKRNIGVTVNLFTRKPSFGTVLFNEETKHWRNCQSFHEKGLLSREKIDSYANVSFPRWRGLCQMTAFSWKDWQLRQCFVSSLKRTVPNDCFLNLFTRKQSFGTVLFNEETKDWRNCQSFHEKAVIWHNPLQRGNERFLVEEDCAKWLLSREKIDSYANVSFPRWRGLCQMTAFSWKDWQLRQCFVSSLKRTVPNDCFIFSRESSHLTQSSSTRKRNIGVTVNLFTRKQSFSTVLFNEETKHWHVSFPRWRGLC
jgi:hypothetical protein